MLKKEHLQNDYECLVNSIKSCIKNKDFERALQLIDFASRIAYQYIFLSSFADVRLENYIKNISELNFEPVSIVGLKNKVLFYDYFGYDNRGLTQQYLRGLMQLGKEIVYILEQPNNYYNSYDIYNELNAYPNATIYKLNKTTNLSKAKELIDIVINEKPSKAFLHLAPWDVVACTAFNAMQGITRYQINLTDHAFWLGINITDVSLEFRSFGYNLSWQKRGIEKSKLRILPYYPIFNTHPFGGLPDQTKDKKVVFSGGSVYKILGENLVFLNLVKEILAVDPDLIFVFAGSGNVNAVNKFIKVNNLENRFILIGDRKDISSVLQNIDYYITTFPFTGALMSQIAAASETPIFFFSKPNYQCNNLSDVFYKSKNLESFNSINDLVNRFKLIYKDESYLQSYGYALKKSMITPLEFTEGLNQILQGQNPYAFLQKDFDINEYQDVACNYLLESENQYNPQYYQSILNHFSNADISEINGGLRLRTNNYKNKHKIKRLLNNTIAQTKYYLKRIYKIIS